MNTIPKDYRLDDIIEIMKEAKFVTHIDLQMKTGKSRSTLKRDIKLLKKYYPQLKTKPGVNGGIFWEEVKHEEVSLRS